MTTGSEGIRGAAAVIDQLIRCITLIMGVFTLAPGSASAQLPSPPKEVFSDVNGVSARTGNINYELNELDIGPEGDLGLHLARYLSDGVLRDSFDSTYYEVQTSSGWSVSASFGNIGDSFGTMGSDVAAFYNSGSPPNYQHKSGIRVTFGQFMWQQNNPFGDYSSDNYWLATNIKYPSGSAITIHYKSIPGLLPSVRIQSVTSNAGYQIKFRYASNDSTRSDWSKRVSATAINMSAEYCDPDADDCVLTQAWPTTSYSRWTEGSTNAFSITNAAGEVTTFRTTPGSPSRFSIALPGSTAEVRTYTLYGKDVQCNVPPGASCGMGDSSRVTQFQSPVKTTSYTYNWQSCVGASLSSNCGYLDQIVSVEPGATSTTYKSRGPGSLGMRFVTDPLGRTQTFDYDQKGLITKAAWPEGNRTEWTRDSNGNVIEERAYSKDGTSVLKQTQTFGPCSDGFMTCTLPLTITDARGNTTKYIYNNHGQKIAEIGPPDLNGIRSVRRSIYTDRYAFKKNASGSLVQMETPVSVLSQVITCQKTFNGNMDAPACASANDEVVTTYEFSPNPGPNALLPIGKTVASSGLVVRTCYGYDTLGNKIWETSPRAGLSACY